MDNCSESDLEGLMDPFLCHYLGSPGSLYLKGNVCSPDVFEVYHAGDLHLCLHIIPAAVCVCLF